MNNPKIQQKIPIQKELIIRLRGVLNDVKQSKHDQPEKWDKMNFGKPKPMVFPKQQTLDVHIRKRTKEKNNGIYQNTPLKDPFG